VHHVVLARRWAEWKSTIWKEKRSLASSLFQLQQQQQQNQLTFAVSYLCFSLTDKGNFGRIKVEKKLFFWIALPEICVSHRPGTSLSRMEVHNPDKHSTQNLSFDALSKWHEPDNILQMFLSSVTKTQIGNLFFWIALPELCVSRRPGTSLSRMEVHNPDKWQWQNLQMAMTMLLGNLGTPLYLHVKVPRLQPGLTILIPLVPNLELPPNTVPQFLMSRL
jgi:hypothetical protein